MRPAGTARGRARSGVSGLNAHGSVVGPPRQHVLGERRGQADVAGLAVRRALPAGEQVGLGGQRHPGEQRGERGRAAVPVGVAACSVRADRGPQRAASAAGCRSARAASISATWLTSRQYDDPVPAALARRTSSGRRPRARQRGECVGVVLGEQLGALQVAEERPARACPSPSTQTSDVLQVGFEDDAVVEVGGQDRRHEQVAGTPATSAAPPPGPRRAAGREMCARPGRVLVGDGGRQQRGGAGRSRGPALRGRSRRSLRAASRSGGRRGRDGEAAVGGLAQHRAAGEARRPGRRRPGRAAG